MDGWHPQQSRFRFHNNRDAGDPSAHGGCWCANSGRGKWRCHVARVYRVRDDRELKRRPLGSAIVQRLQRCASIERSLSENALARQQRAVAGDSGMP